MTVAIFAVASCSNEDKPLGGVRIDVRVPLSKTVDFVSDELETNISYFRIKPDMNERTLVDLPAIADYASWTHINGNPGHNISHPSLAGNLQRRWTVPVGAGNTRKQRITASPVVAGSWIFTMDSQSVVSAFTSDGTLVWAIDLTPSSETSGDASGGGLSYGEGLLFATTAFGELHAIHPELGEVIWVQDFESAAIYAPTVSKGLVFVVTQDSVAWAVDVMNGRLRRRWESTASTASVASGATPAVSASTVFLPFPSGEIIAADIQTGAKLWSRLIGGARSASARARLIGISSAPVVSDGILYAANQSGMTAAFDIVSGSKIWTALEGSYSPVWHTDRSVFVVSDNGELVRLDAETGKRIWGSPLPFYKNERARRRKAVFANFGPVLAGGRLLVASSDGFIRQFDPNSGQLLGMIALPSGAATRPVIVNGTLYLVTENGDLVAFQ